MIKIWLLYLGYFIFLFLLLYIVFRTLKAKPEIKDYGLLTKILVKYRIWKEKIKKRVPQKESIKGMKEGLWEKILRRIKVEALKIEVWASNELEKRKKNSAPNIA